MKKTIAILLVAILAVSSVFAGFSGKASVGFDQSSLMMLMLTSLLSQSQTTHLT